MPENILQKWKLQCFKSPAMNLQAVLKNNTAVDFMNCPPSTRMGTPQQTRAAILCCNKNWRAFELPDTAFGYCCLQDNDSWHSSEQMVLI